MKTNNKKFWRDKIIETLVDYSNVLCENPTDIKSINREIDSMHFTFKFCDVAELHDAFTPDEDYMLDIKKIKDIFDSIPQVCGRGLISVSFHPFACKKEIISVRLAEMWDLDGHIHVRSREETIKERWYKDLSFYDLVSIYKALNLYITFSIPFIKEEKEDERLQ